MTCDVDLAACIQGDRSAWDAFVERYAPVMNAAVRRVLARRGVHDETLREDVLQEIFVRLVKNGFQLLRSYDPERASFATWLTVVARSKAIDVWRRRDRAPWLPDEALDQVPAPEPEPTEDRPIPSGLLSPRQQLVLRLLYDEDRDVAEAAALLRVSHQTIRSTRHKALDRLRAHFGVAS